MSQQILEQVQDLCLGVAFPGPDHPLFWKALTLARTQDGVSSYGLRYEVSGTRCSGDAHTSIGNGIVNRFNTWFALNPLPEGAWESVHEGDDGIIGVAKGFEDQVMANLAVLNCLGFTVKIDRRPTMDSVSFCGRHLYYDASQLKDHADLLRALDKFHTSVSNVKSIPLIYAKACSYYHTDSATPVLGPLCYHLIRLTEPLLSFSQRKRALHAVKKERFILQDASLSVNAKRPLVNISSAARVSVVLRSGIDIAHQHFLEDSYSRFADGENLTIPPIPREWLVRTDGYVYGNIPDWVRR